MSGRLVFGALVNSWPVAPYLRSLIVVVAVTSSSRAAAPAKDISPLITTESHSEDAKLVAADAEWKWTFKAGDVEHVVAAREVVRYGHFARPSGQHRLRLLSGDEIVGFSVKVADDQILLESDLLEVVTAPVRSTAAVVYDMPTDPAGARLIDQRIAAAAADRDTVLFSNGDQLAGQLLALTKDKATFASSDREFAVDLMRLSAIVFKRAQPKQAGEGTLATWVGLRDGSRMLARKFIVRGDRTTIELADGVKVAVAREAIVAIQPIGGDLIYLSDLADAGYRHIPFLSLAWDYQRDHNVTGGPIVADGRRYLKGLGMHSAARITYNLDTGCRRFQSELAIDDSTSGRGSVSCRVFTDDGSGKWQAKYDSPVIRGREKPLVVDVDLAGVKRISLLVDFADRGDEQDHVNWLDARLIK